MDNKNTITIILITLLLIIIMALAGYLTSGISPIKSSASKKRFSAPPGKSMENSLVIVSKKRENTFSDGGRESAGESKIKTLQLPPRVEKGNHTFDGDKKENTLRAELTPSGAKFSEEMRKSLLEMDFSQNLPTDKLDQILNSTQNPRERLNVLRDNIEILISKGLTTWVETKLNEIISSSKDNVVIVSESNLLRAQIELSKGELTKAEELLRQTWETISSTNVKENEELVRLIGLNYAQVLMNNRKEEDYQKVVQFIKQNFLLPSPHSTGKSEFPPKS